MKTKAVKKPTVKLVTFKIRTAATCRQLREDVVCILSFHRIVHDDAKLIGKPKVQDVGAR